VSSARHAARLIIFRDHEVLFRWFECFSRSASGFVIHWGKRTGTSARSPSVLVHYWTLTSRAFDLAFVVVGRCTFSTPSRNSAVTFVLSASSGSVKLRRKVFLNPSAGFFRHIGRLAFLPVGGGGTRGARRIASLNLIARESLAGLAVRIIRMSRLARSIMNENHLFVALRLSSDTLI
jgi:hypothetical protein